MDVSPHASAGNPAPRVARGRRSAALLLIVILGLALRLYDVRNPILDHPAWRQGDEAAIARNFFELRNNILYPQTDYNGPAPNYVELELQIVPYAAAQAYRLFGVHEIFGRLLVIALSVATLPVLYALGALLYCRRAGLLAALLFAIAPGAVFYGRAIIPESAMLFFGCLALLFWWYWLTAWRRRDLACAVLFCAIAWLAKPPALVLLVPMVAAAFVRLRGRPQVDWWLSLLLVLSLAPYQLYFSHLHAIAEWHWTSGILAKHVVPALTAELESPARFVAGIQSTLALLKMLATTILGPVLFGLLLLAALAQPPEGRPARSAFFGAWLAALCVYCFAVVNVVRVDYYLVLFVPFAALYAGGALDYVLSLSFPYGLQNWKAGAALLIALFFAAYVSMLEIHDYYTWSRPVFSAAAELRAALEPNTLIVMGHYDPSVLYSIGHRGWEEDVLLWNVRDMTSAIGKGARYFVAIEVPRFKANRALYRFMQRYRRVPLRSGWQVYDMHHFAKPPALSGR